MNRSPRSERSRQWSRRLPRRLPVGTFARVLVWLLSCGVAALVGFPQLGHAARAPTSSPQPGHAADAERAALVVFGAASLADALQELGTTFEKSTGQRVKLSFAASSALARQIESGAPADVFVSADIDWMDYLQKHDLIQPGSRHDLLGNRLVLIAPVSSTLELPITQGFALAAALGGGRLAVGDPDSVPAGRYARAALTTLGVWNSVAGHLASAENVRAALALVARGEAPLGIVYRTDALIDKQVRIVGTFPAGSHAPIVYPIACIVGAKGGASGFVDYLRAPAAGAVFVKYGFAPLQ